MFSKKIRVSTYLSLFSLIFVSACQEPEVSIQKLEMDSIGRRLYGVAQDYQVDPTDSTVLAQRLDESMAERRKFAWSVVEKVVRNVKSPNLDREVPLWRTWYSVSEVSRIFKAAYTALNQAERDSLVHGFSAAQVEAAMVSAAATHEGGLGEVEFNSLLNRINQAEEAATLGAGGSNSSNRRTGFSGLSPAYVKHVMMNYKDIIQCDFFGVDPELDLMDQPSFSPCMPEFSRDTVMIKTSWEKVEDQMDNFDFSPESWAKAFASGKDPINQLTAKVPTPDANRIFRMRTRDGQEWALRAIHIVTKEVREWVWISLSWSANPDLDLGSDRPATIPTPWNNYKLTVVSNFEEKDPTPYMGADGLEIPTLKKIFELKQAEEGLHLTSWGTDPHIEQNDPKSNCIGCHQGFGSNRRERKNFPTDFTFQLPTIKHNIIDVMNSLTTRQSPAQGPIQ